MQAMESLELPATRPVATYLTTSAPFRKLRPKGPNLPNFLGIGVAAVACTFIGNNFKDLLKLGLGPTIDVRVALWAVNVYRLASS